MQKNRIHVDRLKIRLPRSMAGDARRIAGNIGREMMRKLADGVAPQTGAHRIDQLVVRGAQNESREIDLQGQIAQRVVSAVTQKLEAPGPKR